MKIQGGYQPEGGGRPEPPTTGSGVRKSSKLTAKLIPYSGIVGQGIMILDDSGAVVAQIVIMVPDRSRDYKTTAEDVATQIMSAF